MWKQFIPVGSAGVRALAGAAVYDNWRLHGGTQNVERFSPLTQINEKTVSRLGLVWSNELGTTRGLEATPIVDQGVIYTTGAPRHRPRAFPGAHRTQMVHVPDRKWSTTRIATTSVSTATCQDSPFGRCSMPPPTGWLRVGPDPRRRPCGAPSIPSWTEPACWQPAATGSSRVAPTVFSQRIAPRDGEPLWRFDAGTGIMAPPVTYTVDAVQYATVLAGWGGAAGSMNTPAVEAAKPGFGRILTFVLNGAATLAVPPLATRTLTLSRWTPPGRANRAPRTVAVQQSLLHLSWAERGRRPSAGPAILAQSNPRRRVHRPRRRPGVGEECHRSTGLTGRKRSTPSCAYIVSRAGNRNTGERVATPLAVPLLTVFLALARMAARLISIRCRVSSSNRAELIQGRNSRLWLLCDHREHVR